MNHRATPVVLAVLLYCAPAAAAQDAAAPIIRSVEIAGASVYTADQLAVRHGLVEGQPLPAPAAAIARAVEEQYHDDGYTLAAATASFDAAAGALRVGIDEGEFDAIEIEGVPERTALALRDWLALRPGEIFNRVQADRALGEALAQSQGAVEAPRSPYRIDPVDGRRVLVISLQERLHRAAFALGTQGREDWYSPVDALNLGLGANGTLFDSSRFNHTYWSGYFTYKFGPERAGYSFGLERAFFAGGLLQAGGVIHDITGTDDRWRLSDTEQSLVAFGFRNTFRDYHRRKGFQLHAALRPFDVHEVLVVWRDEAHQPLVNETSYGLFRDEHPFRENAAAAAGDLRSVVLVYTFDSRGFSREPAADRYRRHLSDSLFGELVETQAGLRLDWRSEFAPASLGHDFDFTRHILQARAWWEATRTRTIGARVIAGTSSGALPPQRTFALGGIGSVRGHRFKETSGDAMLLLNAELRQELWTEELAGLVLLDLGRVYDPSPGSTASWLTGVGLGLELDGGARVEFGWRLDDIPRSLQVLFRLRPTF